MLICPDCNYILTTKTFPTDAPGGRVEVDHCPNCGGVWFDHFEINRFPTYYAIRLSGQLTAKKLKKLNGSGLCPHCGIRLKRLKAATVAKRAHVRICPHCRGHWLSRKDLVKVKKTQEKILARAKLFHTPLPSVFAVLIPLLVLSLVVATIPLTVKRLEEANQARIAARELIGAPVLVRVDEKPPSRSVVLSFTTSKPVTSTLSLRGPEQSKELTLPINTTLQQLHTIRLTGLSPTTTYTYLITVVDGRGVKTVSPTYQFTTP